MPATVSKTAKRNAAKKIAEEAKAKRKANRDAKNKPAVATAKKSKAMTYKPKKRK